MGLLLVASTILYVSKISGFKCVLLNYITRLCVHVMLNDEYKSDEEVMQVDNARVVERSL